MHIETVESIILPNELYVLIRVLNKNKNNKKRDTNRKAIDDSTEYIAVPHKLYTP